MPEHDRRSAPPGPRTVPGTTSRERRTPPSEGHGLGAGIEDWVRARPVTSILVAAVAGFLLGRLIRR